MPTPRKHAGDVAATIATPAQAGGIDHPSAQTKIGIVQSILDDLLGGSPLEKTVILSGTRGVGSIGRNPDGIDTMGRIASLVLEGRSIEALAACHSILSTPDRQGLHNAMRPRLGALQKLLEQELLVPETIDLAGPSRTTSLLPRRSILIGRPSPGKTVDVAVNCRWFSRADRHLSLFSEGSNWFVEELGSTNGSFLDGKPLRPGHPVVLQQGQTAIEIGKTNDAPAPVTVHMHRPAKDPGAVVIALSGDADANERAPQTWPSMAADMCRRWVVCRAQVGVGGSEQCAVQIDNPAPGILAAIRYQKGFWAVPSSNANLQIAGMDFSQPVPLVAGTSLCLAGTMLQISAPQTQASAHAVSNPQHRHAG